MNDKNKVKPGTADGVGRHVSRVTIGRIYYEYEDLQASSISMPPPAMEAASAARMRITSPNHSAQPVVLRRARSGQVMAMKE